MMLLLLLTELIRLDVHLSSGPDGLHIQAPAGTLTDELHQRMMEHKAALLATLPLHRFQRNPSLA